VINGLTLGHGEDFLGLVGLGGRVDYSSGWSRIGNATGTALDIPFAWAAPTVFGYVNAGSTSWSIFSACSGTIPSTDCVNAMLSGAASGYLGLAAGAAGDKVEAVLSLLSNLIRFGIPQGSQGFSIQLASSITAK
jgi:hypothetical protein